jgi:hypothetical protein
MVSRKLGIYGFISAAAIVSGILAGCGGSNSVAGLGGTVSTTGGVTTSPGTSATGAASSPSPQQVQVTTASGPVTGTLPAGESIPVGGTVATIPPGVPFIVGLTLSTAFNGHKTVPTPAATGAKPTTGQQGQVYVDGQNTGLTVDSSGDLSGYLILTAGHHTITAYGPFSIVGGSAFAPTQLTVGVFNFGVVVLNDGMVSVPSGLNMRLPSNGGSWAHGPFVVVTYPTPDFASGNGQLIIVVDAARTIQESKTFSNGVASYYSLGSSLISHNVPASGVLSVTFNASN